MCLTGAVTLVAASLLPSAARAQDYVPPAQTLYQDGHGGRHLLGGQWHFRIDREERGIQLGFHRQRSLEGWSPVEVPNAWNATDLSEQSYRGTVGWYRKDFRVPPGARPGVVWRFRFESVNYRATVYLNGRLLDDHEGVSLPFELPARGLTRGVNRLVVRVSNRRDLTSLPPARDLSTGQPGGGWWNYGGILREVYLRRIDRVDIEELLARPQLRCRECDAKVFLRARVQNRGGGRQRVRLVARVGDQTARFRPATLDGGQTRELSARVKIRNPRLWEPGSPNLYPVQALAFIGGRAVARHTAHIGIRSIKVNGRGEMLINDRRFRLRGASMHEDHPVAGAAFGPEQRARNFSFLQELGANMTRSHYPLHPEFYEMADRAGIVVWAQIPFYRLRLDALRLRTVRRKGVRYLEDTIRRDQNHPSIITWSIANELSTTQTNGQRRYIADARRLAKRRDPTRLVGIDFPAYPPVKPLAIYNRLDALGVNNYFGWYPGPTGLVENRENLGPYLDDVHRQYPDNAIFATEFGAEANRDGPADEKGTYAYQRDLIAYHLGVYDQKPYLNGATIWILRDFRVRPGWAGGNPNPSPPVNKKGLVDEYGQKKPAFGVAAENYRTGALPPPPPPPQQPPTGGGSVPPLPVPAR